MRASAIPPSRPALPPRFGVSAGERGGAGVMGLRHPLCLLAEVSQLAQHAEVVSYTPVFGDAVAFEAVHVDVIDGE